MQSSNESQIMKFRKVLNFVSESIDFGDTKK